MPDLEFQDWGLIDYKEAAEKQLLVLEQVAGEEVPDQIVFCSHPEVVTLGKSSSPSDITGWQGSVVKSSRGGKATYHGPEQLVIYPILKLTKERTNLRIKDIHHFLRQLELVMIQGLKELGVEADRLPVSLKDNTDLSSKDDLLYTGVWVGEQKLASIGIAVKKWTTYHGAAINLFHNPNAFSGINPCGFQQNRMTHIEAILGKRLEPLDLQMVLKPVFQQVFQ